MEESDYWPRLEYRVSAEFAGFADRELRRYWCDGLVPDDYDLHGEVPCVRGRAWCGHSGGAVGVHPVPGPYRRIRAADRRIRAGNRVGRAAA